MVNTQRDEHKQAMTFLLRATLGQTVDSAALETAKQHVASCSVCWARFGRLVEALTGAPVPAWAEDDKSTSISVAPTFGEQWRLQHHAPEIEHQPGHWQRDAGYLARLTQEVEKHLRVRPRDREELNVLKAGNAPSSKERRRLRARLLHVPVLAPATRGETSEVRRYRLSGGELLLTQWADTDGIRLVGTLQVRVPGMVPPFDQVEAVLLRGGHEQERVRLDSGGTFVLRPSKPGRYSVRIRWPEHEIHGIGITVGEAKPN